MTAEEDIVRELLATGEETYRMSISAVIIRATPFSGSFLAFL